MSGGGVYGRMPMPAADHAQEPIPRANTRGRDLLVPVPPISGQSKTKIEAFKVGRNNATGVFTRHSVSVYAETPDPRLLATIAYGFRQDGSDVPSVLPLNFPAGHVVSADLYVRTDKNVLVATNHIYDFSQTPTSPTFRAPWAYRWADTPGRLWATLTVPNAPGTGLAMVGDWWAVAQWNLAPGAYIDDNELQRLFAACTLTQGSDAIVVSQTGAP